MNQLHIRLYFRCFMFQNWEVHNIHIFLFFELYTMFWFKSPERETSVVVTSATGELKPLAHAPPPPPFSRSACAYCRRARGAREAALPREATRCSSSEQNRTEQHGTAQHSTARERTASSGAQPRVRRRVSSRSVGPRSFGYSFSSETASVDTRNVSVRRRHFVEQFHLAHDFSPSLYSWSFLSKISSTLAVMKGSLFSFEVSFSFLFSR